MNPNAIIKRRRNLISFCSQFCFIDRNLINRKRVFDIALLGIDILRTASIVIENVEAFEADAFAAGLI